MKEMTKQNLEAALAGESQAHIKYLAFSAKAEREGKPNTARLLHAIAYAEQVHATNHLKELGGIGDTVSNLQAAINGEDFEVGEMYSAYLAVAELQEEKGAKPGERASLGLPQVRYQQAERDQQTRRQHDVAEAGL